LICIIGVLSVVCVFKRVANYSILGGSRFPFFSFSFAEIDQCVANVHFVSQDLNVDPVLPFGSESFDFVTNTASVDYMVDPRAVLRESHRVLRPGGVSIVAFSNRCFDTKATAVWIDRIGTGPGLMHLVTDFFGFSADWAHISTIDVTPQGTGDPMWVVVAVKKG
jgi:SAM-dependent methyltransferase